MSLPVDGDRLGWKLDGSRANRPENCSLTGDLATGSAPLVSGPVHRLPAKLSSACIAESWPRSAGTFRLIDVLLTHTLPGQGDPKGA